MTSYTLVGMNREVQFKYFIKKMAGTLFSKRTHIYGIFGVTSQNITILFLGKHRRIIYDRGKTFHPKKIREM